MACVCDSDEKLALLKKYWEDEKTLADAHAKAIDENLKKVTDEIAARASSSSSTA